MDDIKSLIKVLAGTNDSVKSNLFDAEVVSVDEDSRTCVVNSIDGLKIVDGLTVRLMLDVSDGDLIIPEIGSTIQVAITDYTEPYMVTATWVTKRHIIVGNQGVEIVNDGIKFNDGKLGGFVIIKECLSALNRLEDKYNDLVQKHNALIVKFNTHVHPGVQTGGGSTLITTSISTDNGSQISPKTKQSDLENDKITHGKAN